MSIQHNYVVDLNWVKERVGIVYSPELNDEIQVATPPQFPKGVEKVWSPEHLLVAAVESCYMTTFLAIAENFHLEFKKMSCHAEGKLEMVDGRYMISEVMLAPKLAIAKEEDREKAEKVMVKAEANCLISNSVKCSIVFQPHVVVEATSPSSAAI